MRSRGRRRPRRRISSSCMRWSMAKRHQLRPVARGGSSPSGCGSSAASLRSARCATAVVEEELQLLPGRVFRRAEQARDGEGAAGIGPGARGRPVLAAQPAAQEAGHEGVAGAEHVVDLDREALADDAVLEVVGDRARRRRCSPSAPRLQTMVAAETRADGAQRRERVGRAAGDLDLLLGADDQVAIGQRSTAAWRSPRRLST